MLISITFLYARTCDLGVLGWWLGTFFFWMDDITDTISFLKTFSDGGFGPPTFPSYLVQSPSASTDWYYFIHFICQAQRTEISVKTFVRGWSSSIACLLNYNFIGIFFMEFPHSCILKEILYSDELLWGRQRTHGLQTCWSSVHPHTHDLVVLSVSIHAVTVCMCVSELKVYCCLTVLKGKQTIR